MCIHINFIIYLLFLMTYAIDSMNRFLHSSTSMTSFNAKQVEGLAVHGAQFCLGTSIAKSGRCRQLRVIVCMVVLFSSLYLSLFHSPFIPLSSTISVATQRDRVLPHCEPA